MTPHGLIEFMETVKTDEAMAVIDILRDGVAFYAGDIASLPNGVPFDPNVKPPFETTVIHTFDAEGNEAIVGCQVGASHAWQCFCAGYVPGRVGINLIWFIFKPVTGQRWDPVEATADEKEASRNFCAFLCNFFSVIACSNVRMVDVPAPEALNKKRAKAGKPHIKSHKVLHIVAPSSYSKAAPQGGTHASPRVHLRRGHIRKNPSGTTTWVQQCVVGSKHGIVTKDYRVSYA